MSTLLEKQIKINRIVTTSIEQAHAIEDAIRAKIVEILYHKELTAEQIANELKKAGFKKALTTIRHHIEILKNSGLIEIAKIEERRGAIAKFYGTSTKLLGFDLPTDFESKYSSEIERTSTKIEKLLKNIEPRAKKIKKQQTPHNYSEYLLVEIMNRALANVLENSNSFTRPNTK